MTRKIESTSESIVTHADKRPYHQKPFSVFNSNRAQCKHFNVHVRTIKPKNQPVLALWCHEVQHVYEITAHLHGPVTNSPFKRQWKWCRKEFKLLLVPKMTYCKLSLGRKNYFIYWFCWLLFIYGLNGGKQNLNEVELFSINFFVAVFLYRCWSYN